MAFHNSTRWVTMKGFIGTKVFLIIALAALCLLLILTLYAEETATVVDIADGDTLTIDYNGKMEPVNLIGIDAPESVMNRKAETDSRQTGESLLTITSKGIDAKRFVERIVKKGDMVALSFDVQMRDQEGKLQGYVYLPDGRMLNEEIVRAGYAKVIMVPPNVKYKERFLEAYKEAKAYRRGLWKTP
jgi:micrococcal nuclease